MSEDQSPPQPPEELLPIQEQEGNKHNEVLEELVTSDVEQSAEIKDQSARIEYLEARLAELEAALAERQSSGAHTDSNDGAEEVKVRTEQKPDTVRDLERLAAITGRPADDPELIKLHLRLKLDQFNQMADAYDAQEGTVRQVGFMQDVATAKRELEEAMYVYDPRFAELREKEERLKARLARTTDPAEKTALRQEIFRLKDHGQVDGHGEPRRDIADDLTRRLHDITGSLDGSEILATYELHQTEYPAEPLSERRRTDTLDWRSKPEYDSNGVYIGSSPARNGGWILEPRPPQQPLDAHDSAEVVGETDPSVPPTDGQDAEPDVVSNPDEALAEDDNPDKDSDDKESEKSKKMEVPAINPGDYPELYARRKNLVGADLEAFKAESERLAKEIAANVEAQVNNFITENPNATPEQIRQFSMQCYVEAQNKLQQDIIAALDGQGYTDAESNEQGKSRLRRFGAWLDRHGSKIKKGMLIVGAVGAVAITAGAATGVIVPAFAIGAGTAIGAAKGAAVGLGISRHGSKESASRSIDVTGESYQQLFAEMSPEDTATYARISDYLMQHYNQAADTDHAKNVQKSRRAAIVGAVLGGITGSITFSTSVETSTGAQQTTEVPNKVPAIPKHIIQPGELTGQVIQNTLNDMGMDGSQFVNPDGSTNLDAIHEIVPKDIWNQMEKAIDGSRSIAGQTNTENEGIRFILESIVNNQDHGTHEVDVTSVTTITEQVPNLPATIAGWVTGEILTIGASRQAADTVKPANEVSTRPYAEASGAGGGELPELQTGREYLITFRGQSQPVRFMGKSATGDFRFEDPQDSSQPVTYTPQDMTQVRVQPA